MGCFGGVPIVKILGLLTISFFVFLGASKADSKNLKSFGKLLAIILCIVAAYLFAFKVYLKSTGQLSKRGWRDGKKSGYHKMMKKDGMRRRQLGG